MYVTCKPVRLLVTAEMAKVEKKRNRAANFTPQQTEKLIEFVSLYRDIIENKKTDGITCRAKNEVWEKITELYNAQCGSLGDVQPRTLTTLKLKYEGLKKTLKKKCSEHPAENSVSNCVNLTRSEQKVLRLLSTGSSDRDPLNDTIKQEGSPNESNANVQIVDVAAILQEQESDDIEEVEYETGEITNEGQSANDVEERKSNRNGPTKGDWAPKLLRIPTTSKLKSGFSFLAEQQKKLITEEMEHAKNEERRKALLFEEQINAIKAKEQRERKEHDLRMIKLQLEIEALKNSTSRNIYSGQSC